MNADAPLGIIPETRSGYCNVVPNNYFARNNLFGRDKLLGTNFQKGLLGQMSQQFVANNRRFLELIKCHTARCGQNAIRRAI